MTEGSTSSFLPPLANILHTAMTSRQLRGLIANQDEQALTVSLPDQLKPWAIAALSQTKPILVVTATGREAQDLQAELAGMVGDDVALFPAWETLPHERLSPGVDTVGARMSIMHRLATSQGPRIVVAPVRSFIQPIMDGLGDIEPITMCDGADISGIATRLVAFGYQHVDLVAKRGEFAIRGGVIDIFPSTAELPIRAELWGDEVTDIRPFSVGDQRTLPDIPLDTVAIYPCRELILTEDITTRAAQQATHYASQAELADALHKISEGVAVNGMESLIPLLYQGNMVTLPDLMPQGSLIIVSAPQKVATRAQDLLTTEAEFRKAGWEAAALGAQAPLAAGVVDIDYGGSTSYRTLASLQHTAQTRTLGWWEFVPPGFLPEDALAQSLDITCDPAPAPQGKPEQLQTALSTIREHVAANQPAVYAALTPAAVTRTAKKFAEAGIGTLEGHDVALTGGKVALVRAVLHGGLYFSDTDHGNLLVLAETDFTGNRVAPYSDGRRKPARKRNRVDPLALHPGDYVVHETHGIGKFVRMVERTVGRGPDATRREYLVLEYAPSKRGGNPDQLFVPMDSLDLLSRYVGGEAPTLSKMGGSDWKNTKRKARAAVRDIAADLVQLYAKRQSAPGYAFAPDTPWQREMEDNFPYTETEDQFNAIEAVKADMEKPVPMDRVIVGDVGYGKTEVAVRAAFKAVQSGKQVVVLVPTTLLVQQHAATFRERMEGFPVVIRELSRFTTPSQSREVLDGLANGTVDIVIGTHRLLQTGVNWKNLGLVIVDEEQRFGVEHKEHIKALRTHVDVLTMSATPIPRTLEMSMAGIRDMSTILTPPEDRLPVLTYVGAKDNKQIAAAIRRELLRDGQVFYVHNRVRTIEQTAQEIRTLVPEARVVVAHGQMNEEQLEKTVEGFWEREFDVLVCTTIVETGLDISNANTLIVDNAQNFGLSQLHQLRGRVGRSRQRGYAYFLYPPHTTLSETAYDRLATIAANNDLGAGMAVAMKDLEMRGAGNVLGAEQSGHIAGVGFDLYVRLVGEAVETFKAMADGKPVDGTEKERTETRIDLPVDAHIPTTYIGAERLRLAAYRDLAQAGDEKALANIRAELVDRYGQPPAEVDRLFVVARLRQICREFGVHEIVTTGAAGAAIAFAPIDLPDSGRVRLARLYPRSQYRAATKTVVVPAPKNGSGLRAVPLINEDLLQWCANVVTGLAGVPRRDVIPAAAQESAG